VQEPVIFSYHDGYWSMDGYPYYVHSGYRYRYSPVEMCQYQLVDSASYTVVTNYGVEACSYSYDRCSIDRDNFNRSVNMERYFCAEGVGHDYQVNSDADYTSSPIEINQSKESAIQSYLQGKDYIDLLRAGKNGVGKCSIQKTNDNALGCRFVIKVGKDTYPQTNGSVCSQADSADKIGCNVGNQRHNAGCILKAAIAEGYCI
jgi:hypothetical protein